MISQTKIISKCKTLLKAYNDGELGYSKMPEDANPGFTDQEKELRLCYFTLPMSLNYQRNSYKLWEAALVTIQDLETKVIFNVKNSANLNIDILRKYLLKYKIALQPNKHIFTWQKISQTIYENWGTIQNLLTSRGMDYLKLKDTVQGKHKKGFPYLSGPKIFNYWCFILNQYCEVNLKNSEYIEIAPDTHITKCSVLLGVISEDEAKILSKEKISQRWRELLQDSGINPIDMHAPLWFWSRNGFGLKLNK